MLPRWWLSLLLMALLAGCSTSTHVVRLDTGQGEPLVFTPPSTSKPVQVEADAFREAMTRLVLDLRLSVAWEDDGREARRTLLASSRGVVLDDAYRRALSPQYGHFCEQQESAEDCRSLLEDGLFLGVKERRLIAVSFALDTVWDGVEVAVRDAINPAALKAMVASALCAYLVLLVAPEPVTKLIAVTLTAFLVAYLGTGPVRNMAVAFVQLMEESGKAVSFSELEAAGHRFGKVVGDNGTRVLILVATAALGGRAGMAARGPQLPGFARAALQAETHAGFKLAAATAGEVHSIGISAGALNMGLAPTAVAATAMGPGGGCVEDHHIGTICNEKSTARGGPWTPRFREIFKKAEMDLKDPENIVPVAGHKGPHPEEYHELVYRRLELATRGCRSIAQCRDALREELRALADEISTPGTLLNKLITQGAQP